MKITAVDTIALGLPYEHWGPKPVFAGRPRNEMEMLLVRVQTDEGITGWGESFGYTIWPATKTTIEKVIGPLIVGRDARDIPTLMLDLQRKLHLAGRSGSVTFALSGVDIALWDIAGKAAQKPLHALLGGKRRDSLPAYASLLRYADNALVARNAASAAKAGFRAIKLHEITVDAVKTAREAVGPDVAIMMDVNCPWTPYEAIGIARGIRPYDVLWFEEPVWPPEDHAGIARVRREGGVATAAGENAASATEIGHLLDANAVDYVQPSVTKIGGVSELVRIMKSARARGVKVVPHSPYFGPGFVATLHAVAAFEDETMIERYHCELGASPLGDVIDVKEGMLRVPDGPGLGYDPDPDILERYRI